LTDQAFSIGRQSAAVSSKEFPMLQYLLARAKEPSSYAGLASLMGIAGVSIAPAEWQAIVGVVTAVASLIAVLLPELGGTRPQPKEDSNAVS
jgi:hypothetical protein